MSAISPAPSSDFIPFHVPSIGRDEVAAALRCLQSGWLTTGAEARAFEKEFAQALGVKHALAVNSCTAALHLALEALDIGPGDRVLTTPFTFTACAEVIRYLGADPLFADVQPDTLNIDPDQIAQSLEQHPTVKAIMPVHIAGQGCDMGAIIELAQQHGVAVVEDAAHALPMTCGGRNGGTLGDAGAFSFYATKTITTGEGGMLATNRDDIAQRARVMRLHGISRDVFDRYQATTPSWYYEVVAPGFKYNMPDMAAAIGRVQLGKSEGLRRQRQAIAESYNEAFADLPVAIPTPRVARDVHAWHLYILQLRTEALTIDRDRFIELMSAAGVGTSVHFIPLHLQPYWRDRYKLAPDDFPVSTERFSRVVSLPIYPGMGEDAQARVIAAVRDILAGHAR